MRRALIVLGFAVAASLAAPALGQPAPTSPPPASPQPAPPTSVQPSPPAAPPAIDDEEIPQFPPEPKYRQPEILHEKPSGFWTSNVPARGGAYRYRLMGIGLVVLAITAFFTIRFLRKVNRARTAG